MADFRDSYRYDGLGRLSQLTQTGQGGASVLAKRIDLAYNGLDQLTGLTRSGSLTGTPLVATTDFTYDPGDRLQTWTHTINGPSPLAYGLSYDPGDRVLQLTQPNNQSSIYSYDRANQLTGATNTFTPTTEGFSYDGTGNRTNPGYQTGPNNELLSDGVSTYTNDEEGNRRTRDKPGESTTYEWDYRNRLTRLVITTPTQTVDAHYTYDVFDHRIGKVVTTTAGMSQTTTATRYVYDGDAIALEFDATNPMAPALTHRYLRAVDQLFADEQLSTLGAGALYWPLTDYQGSVRELLDGSGAVVKQYRYDSFGTRSVVSGSASVDEFFAYTGQALDPETGLQLHWHRYLDPVTGRWLSVDPIPDDINRYCYVRNGPTNATDPSGLESVETWKKKAQEKLVAYPLKTVKDVIENNKQITAFYASLYKLDETAFFWFGMAAYASYGVGQGLADTAKAMKYAPGLEVFGNKTDDIFNILGQGNQAIFLDIAWIAIARIYPGVGLGFVPYV